MLSLEEKRIRRNASQYRWNAANKDRIAAHKRTHYHAHIDTVRPKIVAGAKHRYARDRKIVYDYYGRVCKCCGETEIEFLSIDHVNNDGAEHRRRGASGAALYRAIISEGFPDRYQVLCMNCNFAKGRLGKCPHKIHKENHIK